MEIKTTSDKGLSGRPAIVDGIRTPFGKSYRSFASLMAHDLGRFAVAGLLQKTSIDPKAVDLVTMGTVISDPNTSNVAREIVLETALSNQLPAFTTSMACISSNVAFTAACDMIQSGHAEVAIAGGAETFSDVPIRISKKLRSLLLRLKNARSLGTRVRILTEIRPRDFSLDIPSPREFSTGQTMGEGCERMAKRLGVTRQEADTFAARSHQLAGKAWRAGHYQDHVISVAVPPQFEPVSRDDGYREESTAESLAKLKPAFDQDFGISTAGSSSFFSDGASALLVMSQKKCNELGQKPAAYVCDYTFAAGDPLDELLMGPAFTIAPLLHRNNLRVADIAVWEIHEAFAAQIVANLKFLAADKSVGEIPLDKLNLWGGSLSLGHPFGATGGRLLITAVKRLQAEKGRYAIVAGCAAGGQGSAILLENAQFA